MVSLRNHYLIITTLPVCLTVAHPFTAARCLPNVPTQLINWSSLYKTTTLCYLCYTFECFSPQISHTPHHLEGTNSKPFTGWIEIRRDYWCDYCLSKLGGGMLPSQQPPAQMFGSFQCASVSLIFCNLNTDGYAILKAGEYQNHVDKGW